jgi:hypothetical protein
MHEYCKMVPRPSPEQYRWLVDDLRKTGRLIEPITLFEGKILDGWSPYKACSEAGIEPHYTPFQGDRKQAFDFMLSKNLARRHLTIEQRKELALQIFKEDPSISTNAAAKKVGLSPKTAETVRQKRGFGNSKPNRVSTTGRRVGGRPKHSESPAQMTRETEAAIAAVIEESLRNLGPCSASALSKFGGRGYTTAQVQHVLDIMLRDHKVIKVGVLWKWNDHNGQAEPAITDPKPEAKPAETPMEPAPEVRAWAEKFAAFLTESLSDIHFHLDFIQCCGLAIRILIEARDDEIEQARRDDEQDEAGAALRGEL